MKTFKSMKVHEDARGLFLAYAERNNLNLSEALTKAVVEADMFEQLYTMEATPVRKDGSS